MTSHWPQLQNEQAGIAVGCESYQESEAGRHQTIEASHQDARSGHRERGPNYHRTALQGSSLVYVTAQP